MSSSIRLGLAGLMLAMGISGVQAIPQSPPAQNPPATPPQGAPPTPPVGGSAQPGPGRGGRGGRGNPAAALVAQFCASCHGPTLQGGSAPSLMDDDWKYGADDASIAANI